MRDRSPFDIFGIQERFFLDEEDLRGRYDRLRESLHPDRHVNASATERRVAEGLSADINEAYAVLSDPLRRAACILALRGKDPFEEGDNSPMPVDFLERQLELREQLEGIAEAKDHGAAKAMADGLDAEIEKSFKDIGSIIDAENSDLDGAVAGARKLRYLINCRTQARQAAQG